MAKRISQWVFVLAGLVLVGWGLLTWLAPSTSCRGVAMGPGDSCSYSSLSQTGTQRMQTYEERIAAARTSAPVVVVLGLATAGFGLVLLRPQAASDRKPVDLPDKG